MKIKLLTSMAGKGFVRNPGDVLDLLEVEATRLIAAGYAVAVVETQTKGKGREGKGRSGRTKLERATVDPEIETRD